MNNYLNFPNYNVANQPQEPNPFKNFNFNKCNYLQQKPNTLYETYEGFIRGNMFPDLYNQYKIPKPFDVEPMNEQAQLLTYIDALSFAAHDMNLYLDNYPDNKAMIQQFNQYRMEAEKAIQQYENQYGPLFVNSNASNTCPWAWNKSPWPWEN